MYKKYYIVIIFRGKKKEGKQRYSFLYIFRERFKICFKKLYNIKNKFKNIQLIFEVQIYERVGKLSGFYYLKVFMCFRIKEIDFNLFRCFYKYK